MREKQPPLSKEEIREKLNEFVKNNHVKKYPTRKAKGTRAPGFSTLAPFGSSALNRAVGEIIKDECEEAQKRKAEKLAEKQRANETRNQRRQKRIAIKRELGRRKALQSFTEKQKADNKLTWRQHRHNRRNRRKRDGWVSDQDFKRKLHEYSIPELEALLETLKLPPQQIDHEKKAKPKEPEPNEEYRAKLEDLARRKAEFEKLKAERKAERKKAMRELRKSYNPRKTR